MWSGPPGGAGSPGALLELTAALNWLPVASLLLAEDGSALEVNDAWTVMSGVQAEWSLRYGWLDAVEPLDRAALRARLREAAATGQAGCAYFRLADTAGGQWARWCWRPGPAGRLVLCAVGLGKRTPEGDERRPAASDDAATAEVLTSPLARGDGAARPGDADTALIPGAELAHMVVHRLFGVGLTLEAATGVTEGRGQHWLQEAIGELDALIRDIRAAVFDRPPVRDPSDP